MLTKYRRFVYRNRNKGIPNLMLYLCVANALLYFYVFFTRDVRPVTYLTYSGTAIMQGQIWRCVTWLITYGVGYMGSTLGPIYIIFFILFNNWLSRMIEAVWGTLRMNIFILGGALLTVVVALLIQLVYCPVSISFYYLSLSMLLVVATLSPDSRVMLFGILPLKMRWLAYVDLVLILLDLLPLISPAYADDRLVIFVAYATAPILSIVNYWLHVGRDIRVLFPFKQAAAQRKRRQQFQRAQQQPNPNWADNYRSTTGERPYRHKCTVCGRTDTQNPGLEFRYCSRCKGYFCYCTDHINNHSHIE